MSPKKSAHELLNVDSAHAFFSQIGSLRTISLEDFIFYSIFHPWAPTAKSNQSSPWFSIQKYWSMDYARPSPIESSDSSFTNQITFFYLDGISPSSISISPLGSQPSQVVRFCLFNEFLVHSFLS
jgi:hypothetical protein